MVDTVTSLSFSETVKSYAIFAVGLLILFAGPELSEELTKVGIPETWIPVLQSLSRIASAVLLWLGLSPKRAPIGADK